MKTKSNLETDEKKLFSRGNLAVAVFLIFLITVGFGHKLEGQHGAAANLGEYFSRIAYHYWTIYLMFAAVAWAIPVLDRFDFSGLKNYFVTNSRTFTQLKRPQFTRLGWTRILLAYLSFIVPLLWNTYLQSVSEAPTTLTAWALIFQNGTMLAIWFFVGLFPFAVYYFGHHRLRFLLHRWNDSYDATGQGYKHRRRYQVVYTLLVTGSIIATLHYFSKYGAMADEEASWAKYLNVYWPYYIYWVLLFVAIYAFSQAAFRRTVTSLSNDNNDGHK